MNEAFIRNICDRLSVLESKVKKLEDNRFKPYKKRLELFFYTMYERQNIWYRRFIEHLPQEEWTKDKCYSKYRFTNVYRELDRASQYLIKNIILNKDCWHKYKSDDDNYINLIWKMLFFRLINNPNVFETVDAIADYNDYSPAKFYSYLKKNIISKDIPIAHGAFCQFSQHEVVDESGKKIKFADMGEYFAKYSLKRLHGHIKEIYDWMKQSHDSDKTADDFIDWMSDTLDGCGRFMAHEFFQDMCYIKEYAGLDLMSYDANSATNSGPGSSAGSKYIFKNVKTNKDVIDAIKYLRDIAEDSLNKMHDEKFPDTDGFYYVAWDKDANKYKHTKFNFTLNQIEMWLCEFYKYVKYKDAKGTDEKVRVRNYSDKKSSDDLLY